MPVVGGFKEASGSGTVGAWVEGAGVKMAFPDLLTPPTTLIWAAVMLALPLAIIADADVESACTMPEMLMLPLPDMFSSPLVLPLFSK